MDNTILKNWINIKPLTKREMFICDFPENISKKKTTQNKMDNLLNKFSLYLNKQLPFKYVKTSACATNFINELFEKYVDDETLVITSSSEHDNVKSNLKKCKNVIEFYSEEINSCNCIKLIQHLNKYKKFFVYFIGTQVSTGEITPTYFLHKINNLLPDNRIFVLDAVQEMFMLPRDYSMFNYVIGTAHALIRDFDIGLCFCNDDNLSDDKEFDFETYFKALEIILSRKDKLFMFPTIMREYFSEYVTKYKWKPVSNSLPNFLSIKTDLKFNQSIFDTLDKYEVRFESNDFTNAIIRMRGQQFIQFPNMLEEGLSKLNRILPYLLNR